MIETDNNSFITKIKENKTLIGGFVAGLLIGVFVAFFLSYHVLVPSVTADDVIVVNEEIEDVSEDMNNLDEMVDAVDSEETEKVEEETEEVKEDEITEEKVEESTVIEETESAETTLLVEEEISADSIVELKKGQNLSSMLIKAGIDNKQTYLASTALNKLMNLKRLKAGQKFSLNIDNKGLYLLKIEEKDGSVISVRREDNDDYKASRSKMRLEKITSSFEGVIEGSFFKSAKKSGMNNAQIDLFIKLYKDTVSFGRDLRKGDKFTAFFESFASPSGKYIKDTKLLFASIEVKGSENNRYYYVTKDGFSDYYDEKGNSVSRFLTIRPLSGKRISSRFGKRIHPVLGHVGFHYGVDYPAKRGTPVYAAGDGIVSFVGTKGTYGKYVQIKHNRTYSTAYAHLNSHAKGLKKWQKVKKGTLIGYVGNTGISTGAHLHFEVHKNAKKIDPLKQYAIAEKNLKGAELKSFRVFCSKVNPRYARGDILEKANLENKTDKVN